MDNLESKMVTYVLDVKVFEAASIMEVPFYPPSAMHKDGTLKLGYHQIRMRCTPDQYDDFMEWCRQNESILKVIGSEIV